MNDIIAEGLEESPFLESGGSLVALDGREVGSRRGRVSASPEEEFTAPRWERDFLKDPWAAESPVPTRKRRGENVCFLGCEKY